MEASQPSLFDTPVAPVCDAAFRGLSRLWLDDEAWVDHQPGWLRGHATLMDALARRHR